MPQHLTMFLRSRPANRALLFAALGCCGVFAAAAVCAEPGPAPIDRSVIQQFVTSGQQSEQSKPDVVVAAPTPPVEAAPVVPAEPAPAKPVASTPAAGLAAQNATAPPPSAPTGYAGQPAAMDSALIRQLTGGQSQGADASAGAKSLPQAQMDLIQQVFAPEMAR